jgi:hypothetical protein
MNCSSSIYEELPGARRNISGVYGRGQADVSTELRIRKTVQASICTLKGYWRKKYVTTRRFSCYRWTTL